MVHPNPLQPQSGDNEVTAYVSGTSGEISDTSNAAVIAAPGAGISTYITEVTICNSDATVATVVNLKDGTTTLHSVYAAATSQLDPIYFDPPLKITAATAFNAAAVTTAAEVYVSAVGYQGAG